MELKVYAKLNLALNIIGTESGMHIIDTVMSSISLFDRLTVEESGSVSVHCSIPVSGKNIALKAAESVYAACGKKLRITIQKGIPMGGGLGGSSADAAAVLVAADKMFGLSKITDINELALSLGADVPYMMRGGLARAQGVGEVLTFSKGGARGGQLLIVECGSVSTAECYKLSDQMDCPSADIEKVLKTQDHKYFSNALLPPARKICAGIKRAEETAQSVGGKLHLSGSGGCMFCAADDKIKAALKGAGFVCHDAHFVDSGIEITFS